MEGAEIKYNDDQLQSRVISFLRFPLIVGVLFIHSQTSLTEIAGYSNIDTPVFNLVRDVVSYVLSAVSVPIFFIVSGYLFFYNADFTKDCYLNKLKKRARTLLIPYLFWNGVYLVFNIVVAYVPFLASVFQGNAISVEYILSAFWGCKEDMNYLYPIAYQFWFIRDLMIMIILSPIFYIIVRYTKYWGLACIALLWGIDFSIPYLGMRGMGSDAIFFFMLGSWFSINNKNLILESKKVVLLSYILYPILVIIDVCSMQTKFNPYIHNLGIIVGIVLCFNIAYQILLRKQISNLTFWSSASFFVFAIHDPWLLTQIRKLTISIFHPINDMSLIFFYFANVLLTIVLAVCIYVIMNKIAPSFIKVVTGGR